MRRTISIGLFAAAALASGGASAQSIIKNPGQHPQGPELEPHLVVSPFRHFDDPELGIGFRATFQIGRNNFISSINNSVGIGVGAAWVPYCRRGCGGGHFIVPVVMQWNFYVTKAWSFYAEPGALADFDIDLTPRLMLQAGARWHFKDSMSLTFRIGYPYASVGISFL